MFLILIHIFSNSHRTPTPNTCLKCFTWLSSMCIIYELRVKALVRVWLLLLQYCWLVPPAGFLVPFPPLIDHDLIIRLHLILEVSTNRYDMILGLLF